MNILAGAAFVAVLALLLINGRLTGEVLDWVPQKSRRNRYLLSVWLLPVVGAILVYRRLALRWFDRRTDEKRESGISTVMVSMDAMFNPGSRHILDARQKEEIRISVQGEKYDRALPDWIDPDKVPGETDD